MSATITTFPGTTLAAFTVGAIEAPADVKPRAAEPRARASVRTHLRLTRRGRVVLTMLVVVPVLAVLAALMLNGGGASATSTTGDVHFEHVTVAAGQTLWQLAEQIAPSADPRDVVADIVSLNNLPSSQVLPGQSLAVPTKYDR